MPYSKAAGGRDRRKVLAYATLLGSFVASFAGAQLYAARLHKSAEPNLSWPQLIRIALAAQWASRTLTQDRVTEPIRQPFAGAASSTQHASEIRRALVELLTCPYCSAPWVASALINGRLFERSTIDRLTDIFAASAAADLLHLMYRKLQG